VWGGGGVAVWFKPIAENTFVRFATYAPGQGDWDDNSWGYTAHNDGLIGVLIYSWSPAGTDPRVEVDRRIPLWGDGTGWWEEHSDQPSFYFPNDTYFNATSSRWYQVWMWAQASCDAAGPGEGIVHFGSSAKNDLVVDSGFCVFEQWT
jgi:hypothetical protein